MIESIEVNHRILIVDDNVSIHDDFRKILCGARPLAALDALEGALFGAKKPSTEITFELESAYQGREAFERVVAANAVGKPFAVAFVDMRMPPGWDGLETIEQLWRVDPALQVVICSAHSDHTWNELHARLGRSDRLLIVKKPFETIEVLQCAHALTAKWNLSRAVRDRVDSLEVAVQARTAELSRQIRERDEAQAALSVSEDQLRQAQKMEAIGQLAAGVAHDFNNILAAILSNAELIADDLGKAHPHASDIQEITDAAQRGASLTRQLLTFSRKQTSQPKILSLNVVVSELGKMLSRIVGEHITMSHSLAPEVGLIKADPSQLDQVLMNLVVNARDAMPDGGAVVIETRNVDVDAVQALKIGVPPGGYVTLTVGDTGCGMDAATRSRVFEPFFTTKEVGKGTGLGLATVFGIVRQHQAAITVASQPNRGTTFQIYFPRTGDLPRMVVTSAPTVGSVLGVKTILIVEDDAQVRHATRRLLSTRGYHCIETESPDEALNILGRGDHVDVLLTDVVMPGIDGRTLATRARTLRPDVRVVFMSGYPQHAASKIAAIGSEEQFVQKPFTLQDLTDAIRRALLGTPSVVVTATPARHDTN